MVKQFFIESSFKNEEISFVHLRNEVESLQNALRHIQSSFLCFKEMILGDYPLSGGTLFGSFLLE